MSRKSEEELKSELADHISSGRGYMAFYPEYRNVTDQSYNNGRSLRERAENNEVDDLHHRSDRFHDL